MQRVQVMIIASLLPHYYYYHIIIITISTFITHDLSSELETPSHFMTSQIHRCQPSY